MDGRPLIFFHRMRTDRTHRNCVLIVDDDAGIRRLLMTFLKRKGFEVVEARNGREALEEMRAGSADVVVMDLMMPEVSGWDVLRERTAEPTLQEVPMIVVTAASTAEVSVTVQDQKVHAVLAKPFDLDLLFSTITTCLGRPKAPILAAA
jgi:DNA-binding response OmpR family regulator